MLSFSEISFDHQKPVYLQLADYMKKQMLLKNIADGDELPSRRELATLLGINPNTVQKAYKQLETEGFLMTSNNVKSIAVANEETLSRIAREWKAELTQQYIEELKGIDVTFQETISLLTELWK